MNRPAPLVLLAALLASGCGSPEEGAFYRTFGKRPSATTTNIQTHYYGEFDAGQGYLRFHCSSNEFADLLTPFRFERKTRDILKYSTDFRDASVTEPSQFTPSWWQPSKASTWAQYYFSQDLHPGFHQSLGALAFFDPSNGVACVFWGGYD